jgi:cellulose synthase/poly-beta-1,6-N-acetylglucosamine synthase-like glycosyltransferase
MMILKALLLIYILKVTGYFLLLLKKVKKATPLSNDASCKKPTVDIVLAMYNEEATIVKTVNCLLKIKYNEFNIIIVDDGSQDNSLSLLRNNFGNIPIIQILHQENAGKSTALNNAMHVSKSDVVICIDADTLVRPDLIDRFLPYFTDPRVGAVAGYLKVGNRKNILTNIQYVEYITNTNFEREAFEHVNGIIVIPGAIVALRRSVVKEVGGFTTDTLTEDNDLALKILCKNYIIRNEKEAVGFTEAPEKLRPFFRQRKRWKIGGIQVLLKFARQSFYHRNKSIFYLAIPYTWLFVVIVPLFTPLMDYYFLYAVLTSKYEAIPYYVSFILIDALICISILIRNKAALSLVLFVIPQRFLLRQLILILYGHILLKRLMGNLYTWDKIVKYGHAKLD